MRKISLFIAAAVLSACSTNLFAQNGVISDWLDMVTQTQSEQPHWITPLATTTPRLEQEFRYDVQWQTHNDGTTTTNVGVSKGVEIIPQKNTEVILAIPPYIINNPDSTPRDGFGDWQFLVKYRLAAGNEEHGNYILTLFYQMTLPTGQYQEGNPSPVITPTVAYGKGFGNFSVQGTLGGSLPTGNVNKIGHTLLWNNTLQYRVFKKFWPETEFNMTRYYGGSHDGHTVLYVTPGMVIGRFPIHNRIAFTFGGGIQIAATSFHPTNHIPILSLRIPF